MNKKNSIFMKLICIATCLLFVFTVIASGIITADTIHTRHCDEENCKICQLINIANQFSKNIHYIIKYIILISTIMPLVRLIRIKSKSSSRETLIDLNVILNE